MVPKGKNINQNPHHLWMIVSSEMKLQEWSSSAKGLMSTRLSQAIAEREGQKYERPQSPQGGRAKPTISILP